MAIVGPTTYGSPKSNSGTAVKAIPAVVVDSRCALGEGPLWHPLQGCMYWLDITGRTLHRWNVSTQHTERFVTPFLPGAATRTDDDALMIMGAGGAAQIFRDGKFEPHVVASRRWQGDRFNDAIADPHGRTLCGMMSFRATPDTRPTLLQRVRGRLERSGFARARYERPGALVRFDHCGRHTDILAPIHRPNGMGFSPDARQFYLTDSIAKVIYVFDYDAATGDLARQRVFVDARSESGAPDGMAVDVDGSVWSAFNRGGRVVRYDTNGIEQKRVRFPVARVTSLAFGGNDLSILFVTSAGGEDRDCNGAQAGALFAVDPGVKGLVRYTSRLP